MNFLIFLLILVPSLAFSQLTITPAPVSGIVDLDAASSTFTFVNSTASPIVMNLALTPKVGFLMGTNRCAGKTLSRNQSCYIIVSVNDSLLLAGTNSTTITQAGSLYFTMQRTKIQGLGSSIFPVTSLAMNDFNTYTFTIQNLTPTTRSYSPVISGIDASKYSISINRCTNVLSAKTCSVSISLAPQSAGTFFASITDPQVTGTLSLSSIITGSSTGVVTPPVEGISVSQPSVDFGTVTRFGVSGYRGLVITNSGNTTISPNITLNGSMLKTALNRCLGILLPGRSCSLFVYLDIPNTEGNGVKSGLSIDVKSSPTATAQNLSVALNLQVSGNGPQLIGSSPMQLVNEVYSVSVGSYHSCALDSNGIARCWGWDGYGQLGAVSYSSTINPLYVRMDTGLSGKTVSGIIAAGWQTCETTTDNKAFCHGSVGGLGTNSSSSSSSPTEIYMAGQLSGKTIKTMSSGYGSSCAIASDDYVYCWGDGFQGSLGNGFNTTSMGSSNQPIKVNGIIQNIKMKQIARNGYSACSLSLDDRLFCWGIATSVPVEVILPNLEKTQFISLGSSISIRNVCVISKTNKIYCMSVFNYEPFEISTSSGDALNKVFSKIVSGSGNACVISEDNYGYCFNPGDATTPPSLIDLCKAPYNKTVKSIGLGQVHTCSSTMDSQVYCWGQNSFGQLGNGTTNASGTPVLVNFN